MEFVHRAQSDKNEETNQLQQNYKKIEQGGKIFSLAAKNS